MNVDVRPEHPTGMSLIARHIARNFEGSDNEEEITQNLEGLTHGIPEYA